MKNNNITVPVKNCSIRYGWISTDYTSHTNASIAFSIIVLIIESWMLKSIHVALFPYLSLKSPLTINISMYCMIYQNDTYTDSQNISP